MWRLRSWIVALLDIRDESARNGDWWETDLILVFLLGVFLVGGIALFSM